MRVCCGTGCGVTIVAPLGSGYRIVPEGMSYPDIGTTELNIFE